MNTSTTLDSLTAAIRITVEPIVGTTTLKVTSGNLYRAYALIGVGAPTARMPYGRYQVHVMAQRDSSKAVVIFNDYGVSQSGANSTRSNVDLASLSEVADQLGQFLLSGKRG